MPKIALSDGMAVNFVREAFASGGHAIGTIVGTIRNPSLMRILAETGYDFAFIDISHSSYSFETIGDMCDMARSCGVVPILRPYDRTPGLAQRLLDIGAMGLIYPDVTSAAEVRALRLGMKYPPEGHRGAVGRGGPSTDYTRGGALTQTEVRAFANRNTLFAIQAESKEAIETLDDILDGGGVDVVEVGRSDLSSSYGVPSEIRHPLVLAALDKVVAACARHGATPGAGCYSKEDAEDMVARGMRWLTYSNDRQILQRSYAEGHKMISSFVKARTANAP